MLATPDRTSPHLIAGASCGLHVGCTWDLPVSSAPHASGSSSVVTGRISDRLVKRDRW